MSRRPWDPGASWREKGGVFARLDAAAFDEIAPFVEWVQRGRGELLFRQGDASDGVFVVVSGRVRVLAERPDGRAQVLGELGAGEVIGEMAFFTGEPRSATVCAARDAVLMRLATPAIDHLVTRHPDVVRDLVGVIVGRAQRAALGPAAVPARTIAVVPLGEGVDVRDLSTRLATAISRFGPATHLHRDLVDAALGAAGSADAAAGDAAHGGLVDWLSDQEDAHRYVVYEATPRLSEWTARCVRQADQVLLVARAASDPARTRLDDLLDELDALAGGGPRRALVLVHPEGTALPAATSRWLLARHVDEHHHLREGHPADVRRLARFVAGRAVGLALGGGGARGFAHIGVLAAIDAAGLAVDLVGGTSMGALVAAEYAMGKSPAEIRESNRRVWLTLQPQKRFALPLFSLLRADGLRKCGQLMFGDADIEDLWLSYFSVSSDLTTAQSVVHRRGPLLRYALASASMPAVAVPVIDDGHLLVDGAVLDNVPGEVPRQLGCARVMVSEVSVAQEGAFSCERTPTLMEVLGSRFRKKAPRPRFPSVFDVLMRSALLASAGREGEALRKADLAFRPPIDDFGLLEFAALDRLVALGEEHARAQIAAWAEAGLLADYAR